MTEEFKDVLVTMIQLCTPFAVLFITWWYNHKQKTSAKNEETERALADARQKQQNERLENAINALNSARESINKLTDENEELKDQLHHVAAQNRLNGKYTHELAQLIMVLAEGIRDQHLDGNITKAVAKYRKFESDVLGSFITGDDDN